MDDKHVPVNSPIDSHTEHNIDSLACHSRDWVNSVQLKSEQLQQRRPKGTLIYIECFSIIFMCFDFRI